ncbi:S41 family peptidase [Engelhardtia mirabilis]
MNPAPRRLTVALTLACSLLNAGSSNAQSEPPSQGLAELYPSDLEPTQPPVPMGWSTGPQHVHRVAGFRFERGERLVVETGPGLVTVGVHPDGPLWAVLEPDEPGAIAGELPGAGEHVRSIFMRFHPAELGALVAGEALPAGDDDWRFRSAVRLAMAKQANSWAMQGMPVVPARGTVVLDCETLEGPRRFYMVQGGGDVEYLPAFDTMALPVAAPVDPADAAAAFDELWVAFDREYAMFGLRDVDWSAQRERFRPIAAQCETVWELGCVLSALVAPLEDRHAWVKVGGELVPHELPALRYNANFKAVMAALEPMTQPRRGINWSRTADDFGYVSVSALDTADLVEHFDRALEELGDTHGLVLDLRFNSGGDETLAQAMAGRFVTEPTTYATQRYRDGEAHDDLGPWSERVLEPREWCYQSPVVVLIGPAVMSSAEGFTLMLGECPGATLVGEPTVGSSGNPRTLELVGGITATVPRWLAADARKQPFEGRGIAPDVLVAPEPSAFTAADPVFERALELLRAEPADARRPGRR